MNKPLLLAALAIVFSHAAPATTVFQCKDAAGRISFQDRCPPGTTEVGAKKYGSKKPSGAGAASLEPVTLYLIEDCEACEQIKEFMAIRGVAVTEKDVNTSPDNQKELQDRIGGLSVPTVLIGETLITGYDRNRLLAALREAGYQPEGEEEGN